MNTINISLPLQLKKDAQKLVDRGLHASFSDLVRDSLRHVIAKDKYDRMAQEAMQAKRKGEGVSFEDKRELAKYFESL